MSVSYPYTLPASYYPPVQAATSAAVAADGPVFTPVPEVKPETITVSKVTTLIEDLFPDDEDQANPDTILKVEGDTVVEEAWPVNPVTGRPISRQAMYKRRKKMERSNE